jgi:DNA polymerase elongation subunit (family B)
MTKRKTTIVTEEFDKEGKLLKKTTETTEEEDDSVISTYPVTYSSYPYLSQVLGQ